MNQHGNDSDLALQRGVYFEADKISVIFKSSPAPLIGHRSPALANKCQEHIALSDGLLDCGDEVRASLDGVEVAEDLGLAKSFHQAVAQSAGVTVSVVTPVADEDAWHKW